ncbi:MAG: short-chain dehydrogenase, partial [Actinomycetes bacterium]
CRRLGVSFVDARPPHTETGLADRAIAGTPPKFRDGLRPAAVADRIVAAVVDGETQVPSTSFVS